jgi:TP901 family phage tail tape measure protein
MAKGIQVPVTQSGLQQSINAAVKNVGAINVPVNINPTAFKNLSQPLGKITGLATEFEKSIAASNARVLAFGASVGIINGVQNALSSLVRTGIEVQKVLADIAAISGATGRELQNLSDGIFDVARNTAQSFQTATQAALEFSRQGLSVEETIKRTNDALTLSRFTGLSAADSVDTLTAAFNSFQETGITTAEILNKLIAVDSAYAVSAADLAKAISRVGSVGIEAGVSLDELNAAVTAVQERTARGGAVIGNAFKTIFTNLRSEQAIKALRDIGVESLNVQGELKPALEVLKELSVTLQGLGEGQRIQVLETVASKYNINILSALTADLADQQSRFTGALEKSAQASTEAYDRQIELNKTLAAVINNTQVSVTQLFDKLSQIGVTQSLTSLLTFVNDLLAGFNKLLDSEGIGGNIAKGLIKGISDVFFTVGLPIIAAIFIKLTKDIAQFGIESLKTILGINAQVRERQALEQAVVNTLIKDQQVMATILSLSGNRAKQEQYLLSIYNQQIAALQKVQSIAQSVAPALMGAGLSATSGSVRRRAAGGYLPSQEAADIRRGVGGASPSSKVVSIPNFAFGGGKRGTMVANTSEYIVPNFANGGSAIFNQDMAKAYGLPSGAKKITASGGYIPNFARYVYDSDRIVADKNALLKAILASRAKKNLIVGPAGSGKTTYGSGLGSFITNVAQLGDATEIDIISGAARTKEGGVSKNFQQIVEAVNASGGKVSYIYAKNMDIYSRRVGRVGLGPQEGDLRSKKQIAGSVYAPMNQFDFLSNVKRNAANFQMVRGARGYIPNFQGGSKAAPTNLEPKKFGGLVTARIPSPSGAVMLVPTPEIANEVNSKYVGAGYPVKNQKLREKASDVEFTAFGFQGSRVKNLAKQSAGGETGIIGNLVPMVQKSINEMGASIVSLFKPLTKTPIDPAEFGKIYAEKGGAAGAASAVAGSIFEAAIDYSLNTKKSKAATQALNSSKDSTFDVRNFRQSRILQAAFGANSGSNYKGEQFADYKISARRAVDFADQVVRNGAFVKKGRAANGFVPNFAAGPLGDAIGREMAAGVSPSKIRVTQDGRLKNSQNPNGLAVINTRDEPNGKIPNYAAGRQQYPKGTIIDGENVGGKFMSDKAIQQSANQQAQPQAKQPDLLKSVLLFSALNTSLSVLQSTVGNTNSTFGKFANSLSSVGFQISSGLLIGGAVKDVGQGFAGRKGVAGALGRASANAGIAGGLIAGGIGIFQELEASREAKRQAITSKAIEESNRELNNISASSLNLDEQKVRALEKQKKEIDEVERIGKAIAQNQEDLSKAQSGPFAFYGDLAAAPVYTQSEEEVRLQNERLDLEKQLNAAVAKEETTQAAIDEITRSIANNTDRIAKEQKKMAEETERMVALERAFQGISLSILKGDNERLKTRALLNAEQIKNAANLNDFQKQELDLQNKIENIREESTQRQRDALDSSIERIAKENGLASITLEQADALREVLKTGKDIADNAKIITTLGIKNAQTINREARNLAIATALEKERTRGLVERTKITETALIEADRTLKLFEAQNERLSQQAQTLREIQKIQKERANFTQESGLQLQIEQLRSGIAQRGTASPTQSRRILELTKELDFLKQRNQIEAKYAIDQQSSLDQAKSKFVDIVRDSSFFSNTEKDRLVLFASQAKSIDELSEKYKSAFGSQEFEGLTPDTIKLYRELSIKLSDSTKAIKENLNLSEQEKQIALQLLNIEEKRRDRQLEIAKIRERSRVGAGVATALDELQVESEDFTENLAKSTTFAFRDGLSEALNAAISQTDNLGDALQNVARNFLQTLQGQFLQGAATNITKGLGSLFSGSNGGIVKKYAGGGPVIGGSGYKDDVPAMLTGGEFVMRKSAVQKYGMENLAKMNDGGIFLPGVRGGRDIVGYGDLTRFAKQTTTSGATDVMRGGASSAFIDLEDQSARLSRFGLLNDDTINQEIRSAQEQALGIIREREQYRTQQRKAFQQQLFSTVAAAALNFGVKSLMGGAKTSQPPSTIKSGGVGLASAQNFKNTLGTSASGPMAFGKFTSSIVKGVPYKAYGGLMPRYAAGGPTDDIPALLMGGEYVMSRQSTRKYGKQFFDAINQGRAPRFANGGMVSTETDTSLGDKFDNLSSKLETTAGSNISININVTSGGATETQTQGETTRGGIDYKKMGDQIRQVVIQTINEEKRLGGSLRSR